MKFTQWFGMKIAPVNIGIYQVKMRIGGKWFARWNGKVWYSVDYAPDMANKVRSKSISCYNGEVIGWRGVAK